MHLGRPAVVAAFVGYGMIGFFVAPRVAKVLIVDIVRERTGRDVEVGEVLTNPFSLSLTVRDFSITDRPGTTVVSFDEFHANAQLSSLLRWAATLKELRVDNPSLGIRRFPDGGVNVLEILEDLKARSPSTDPVESGGGLPRILLQNVGRVASTPPGAGRSPTRYRLFTRTTSNSTVGLGTSGGATSNRAFTA